MRMMALSLAVSALTLAGCGGAPRPRPVCEARPRLYVSNQGAIPICPGMAEHYGCDTFEDYDQNGVADFSDIVAFCRIEREGDSLTIDVFAGDDRRPCYTCD